MVYALVAVLLLSTIVTAGAQDLSVAVVNTQEVFRAHPSFQEVQKELREKQNEMRAELEEEELDEEEKNKKQQQIQQELQKLQQKLVADAVEEVNADVENMADELGYNVVITKGGIISGKEVLAADDITEDILTEMKEE